MNIRLASASKARQALLRNAGISISVSSAAIDERALAASHPDWSPLDTATNLARAKAAAVSAENPADIVIGADQVLAQGSTIFSKPASLGECRQQLLTLRGQEHHLISAVSCMQEGKLLWNCNDSANLSMRDFSEQFLDNYLTRVGHDCLTSVGGYKIESVGVQLFDKIEGDHFTILGLPLLPLLSFLRTIGLVQT